MLHRRASRTTSAAGLLLLLTLAGPGSGETITVEKDGTGDYKVIQDAVDAAASGDTIRIGRGRFDDTRYISFPGWQDSVNVFVHLSELTLLGNGPQTIIGPAEPWELGDGVPRGISAGDFSGNHRLVVQNIRFENHFAAIDVNYEFGPGGVSIRDCSFADNHLGVLLYGDGEASVERCEFTGTLRNGYQCAILYFDNVSVSQSAFFDAHDNTSTALLQMQNVDSFTVSNTTFIGGQIGSYVSNSSGGIDQCGFDGQTVSSVALGISAFSTVTNSWFNDTRFAFQCTEGELRIFDCDIRSVFEASIYIWPRETVVTVNRSNLARGSLCTVYSEDMHLCEGFGPVVLDMTENYWGTDDPDSIASWIHDRNDSPEVCHLIEFEPFATESTPVRTMSLSEMRRLFR
jgi:hypothetical protein